jgi:hypothetical protein
MCAELLQYGGQGALDLTTRLI